MSDRHSYTLHVAAAFNRPPYFTTVPRTYVGQQSRPVARPKYDERGRVAALLDTQDKPHLDAV